MKKLYTLLIYCIVLSGCTPIAMTTPQITADFFTIKVGQTVTIKMTVPNKSVIGGNLNLTYVTEGFFYSPNPDAPQFNLAQPPAPYVPKSRNSGGGFVTESDAMLFPINSVVEIISPLANSTNVASRIVATKEAEIAQVVLSLKGKSVGNAVIRGAFVWSSIEYPQNFDRTPGNTNYDGTITIQVVP